MDRTPSGAQWNERFSSPPSGWGRPPYRGPVHRGGSGRGCHSYSPNSPTFSPGFNRGQRGGGSGGGRRSFGGSPAMFGSGGRNFGEKQRGRNSFGSPSNFKSASNMQRETSDTIERYFSPSMLEDPWAALLPKQTQTSTDDKP
ncbi:M-phase-specific PLK1-interacting protein [Corythoichthys intestinalis]|uniref:M-phase-specific PLK1-interacting protein n=1 Tax=Corythoichthys intestinalis TaxID=161448 RepID=UPI0025A54A4F|nr:M-phase-specific PLK1-interacting protein [Corythoichthys intestinalis]